MPGTKRITGFNFITGVSRVRFFDLYSRSLIKKMGSHNILQPATCCDGVTLPGTVTLFVAINLFFAATLRFHSRTMHVFDHGMHRITCRKRLGRLEQHKDGQYRSNTSQRLTVFDFFCAAILLAIGKSMLFSRCTC